METSLADRWWSLALRGVAAILFGIFTFVSPRSSVVLLVLCFGVYALSDGVLNLILAVQSKRGTRVSEKPWGWLLVEACVSIAIGLLTFMWPRMTALTLFVCIACWSILTGVAEIAAAIRLRKVIEGEWMMALGGVLSIAFGVLLFARPVVGVMVVMFWIGAYAILFGALLLALSFKLRAWARSRERHVPPGGIPTAA